MKLVVNIREGKNGWTGNFDMPGVTGARLSRKDGETNFPTKNALTTVARNVAKKLGLEVEYAEPQKKAAKKTPTKKTTKSSTTVSVSTQSGGCCQQNGN